MKGWNKDRHYRYSRDVVYTEPTITDIVRPSPGSFNKVKVSSTSWETRRKPLPPHKLTSATYPLSHYSTENNKNRGHNELKSSNNSKSISSSSSNNGSSSGVGWLKHITQYLGPSSRQQSYTPAAPAAAAAETIMLRGNEKTDNVIPNMHQQREDREVEYVISRRKPARRSCSQRSYDNNSSSRSRRRRSESPTFSATPTHVSSSICAAMDEYSNIKSYWSRGIVLATHDDDNIE